MYPKQETVQHGGASNIQNAQPPIPFGGTQPTQNMQPMPVGGAPPMQNVPPMPPIGQANNMPMGTQSPYGQTGQLNVQPVIPVHGYSLVAAEYRLHQARNVATTGIFMIVGGIGFSIYSTVTDEMREFIFIGPVGVVIGIGITIFGVFLYKKARASAATNAVGPGNTDASNTNAPATVPAAARQGAPPAALPPNMPPASSPLPDATFPTAPLSNGTSPPVGPPPPPYMPSPPYSTERGQPVEYKGLSGPGQSSYGN